MSFYLDTSFVFAVLTQETKSDDALGWLAAHRNNTLLVSGWVSTELFGALSIKVRSGQFDPSGLARLREHWSRLQQELLTDVAVSEEDFRDAADMASQWQTGLRSGDALHLAINKRLGATVISFDLGMARAATHFGIPAIVP